MQYKLKTLFYLMALTGFLAWWFPRNSVRVLESQTVLYVESILPIDWIGPDEQVSYGSRWEATVYGKPEILWVETWLGKCHFQGPPYRYMGHSR